jgi:hypothetical protein
MYGNCCRGTTVRSALLVFDLMLDVAICRVRRGYVYGKTSLRVLRNVVRCAAKRCYMSDRIRMSAGTRFFLRCVWIVVRRRHSGPTLCRGLPSFCPFPWFMAQLEDDHTLSNYHAQKESTLIGVATPDSIHTSLINRAFINIATFLFSYTSTPLSKQTLSLVAFTVSVYFWFSLICLTTLRCSPV